MRSYLLPIADREPLAWIVREGRTAFPAHRLRDAATLAAGDRLFLYTTRGCFRNPTRDRGRVIGWATVRGPSARLARPVRFGGREYPVGVRFTIERLAPPRGGVELVPLVAHMSTFPSKEGWSARLRRALVSLTDEDAELLQRELERVTGPYSRELAAEYGSLLGRRAAVRQAR